MRSEGLGCKWIGLSVAENPHRLEIGEAKCNDCWLHDGRWLEDSGGASDLERFRAHGALLRDLVVIVHDGEAALGVHLARDVGLRDAALLDARFLSVDGVAVAVVERVGVDAALLLLAPVAPMFGPHERVHARRDQHDEHEQRDRGRRRDQPHLRWIANYQL